MAAGGSLSLVLIVLNFVCAHLSAALMGYRVRYTGGGRAGGGGMTRGR